MKKFKIVLIITVFVFSFLSLFTCYDCIAKGVTSGLYLCADVVIPALFPVLCITSCFANSGVIGIIANYSEKISKSLFKSCGYFLPIFLLSLVSGYPVGASLSNQIYKNGKITIYERNKIALVSCSGGPGFLLLAVGVGIFGSFDIGLVLLITHITTSILVGIIISRFYKCPNENFSYKNNIFIGDALVKGVGSACSCIISICAYTVLFSAVVNVVSKYLRFSFLYKPIVSVLEVTNAVYALADNEVSLPIIAAVVGFGGFSVIFQISSALENLRPPILKIIIVRLFHSALSYFICNIVMNFFELSKPVFKSNTTIMVSNYKNVTFSLSLFALAIVFFSFFYKRKEKTKVSYF